jgi:hypothetical protein
MTLTKFGTNSVPVCYVFNEMSVFKEIITALSKEKGYVRERERWYSRAMILFGKWHLLKV